jgi:hypothetical protein
VGLWSHIPNFWVIRNKERIRKSHVWKKKEEKN